MTPKKINSRSLPALLPSDASKITRGYQKYQDWIMNRIKVIRRIVVYFVLSSLSVSAVVLFFLFVDLLDKYEELRATQVNARIDAEYWKNVAEVQVLSPDVYYQASLAQFKIGESRQALEYINKSIYLDPMFQDAYELKKLIEKE